MRTGGKRSFIDGSALRHAAGSLAWLLLCVLAMYAGATAARAQAQSTLRIAAAADLEPLLPDVLAAFQKQTGIHAEASYQSSATLTEQIVHGAPFDLFMAADLSFPQHVIDAGMATESKPLPYARGTLVLWARNGLPLLHGRPVTLAVLHDSALQSVAIANAEHAPYGRAAQQAIASMQLTGALAPKLRVASNIAQTAQYADSGNAQVGFLSLTSARTNRLRADGTFIEVPRSAYPAILQGAVVLKHGADRAAAQRFLEFLQTPPIRAMLAQKGLMPPS